MLNRLRSEGVNKVCFTLARNQKNGEMMFVLYMPPGMERITVQVTLLLFLLCTGATNKLLNQEDSRKNLEQEYHNKLGALTKERDDLLDLAMQRGKLVQVGNPLCFLYVPGTLYHSCYKSTETLPNTQHISGSRFGGTFDAEILIQIFFLFILEI